MAQCARRSPLAQARLAPRGSEEDMTTTAEKTDRLGNGKLRHQRAAWYAGHHPSSTSSFSRFHPELPNAIPHAEITFESLAKTLTLRWRSTSATTERTICCSRPTLARRRGDRHRRLDLVGRCGVGHVFNALGCHRAGIWRKILNIADSPQAAGVRGELPGPRC